MRHRMIASASILSCAAALLVASIGAASPVQAQGHIRVRVAPPALRVEARAAPPGAGYVWVPGFWNWNGSAHVWVGGHWMTPPRTDYVWRPARWTAESGVWVFAPGGWVEQGAVVVEAPAPAVVVEAPAPTATVEVNVAPPAIRFERRLPRPGVEFVWVPGYWHWRGGAYVWIGGRWDRPQEEGAIWITPRWRHHGHRWVFEPGRWRGHARANVVVAPPRARAVVVARPARTVVVAPRRARTVFVAPRGRVHGDAHVRFGGGVRVQGGGRGGGHGGGGHVHGVHGRH